MKGDDGKDRRGTVTQLTKMGPQVTYDDGKPNPVEIVPSADSGRITVAPKAAAKLPGQDARQQRTAQRMQARTGFKGEVLNTGGDGTHTPAGSSPAPATTPKGYAAWSDAQLSTRIDDLQNTPGLSPAEKKQLAGLTAENTKRERGRDAATAPATDIHGDPAKPTPINLRDPRYRIPAGTSPDNAKAIAMAGMMHGTGSAKHLRAVADYGGPKPKKKATPIPQGFSIGGF